MIIFTCRPSAFGKVYSFHLSTVENIYANRETVFVHNILALYGLLYRQHARKKFSIQNSLCSTKLELLHDGSGTMG